MKATTNQTGKLPITVPRWRSTAEESLRMLREKVKDTAPASFLKSLEVLLAEATGRRSRP